MRSLLLAAVLTAAAAAPARAEVACFSGPMAPTSFSNPGGVAGSGGIVVASGRDLPDWRFCAGNRILRGEVTTIAPGLALYHPPPMVPGVDVVLESQDHVVVAQVRRAFAVGAVPPAPELEGVTWAMPISNRTNVTARLSAQVPAHAMLAIVSRVEGGKVVPLAWEPVSRGMALIELYRTPGYCDQTIPQSIEPKAGQTVVVTWVDDTGRLSAPSKPIVIAKATRK